MRMIIGALLVLEGVSSALRFARLVPFIAIYPPVTLALLGARALIGAALLTSGVWLFQQRVAASVLARASLLASAALLTFEIGFALVPHSIFPVYRVPAVTLYWIYAVALVIWLRRQARDVEHSGS